MAKERESIRQFNPLPLLRLSEAASYWLRLWAVFLAALAICMLVALWLQRPLLPVLLSSLMTFLAILLYLTNAELKHTSAMAEAKLMALSARIRPHFLFNSLNAVVSTIRTDPRMAESALEELAELFRALLKDPRDLVPLSEELALCRKYLGLERLRLGERVQVVWEIENFPPDTLVPPLMLQPLLENAVYHGIEPLPESGVISIKIISTGGMMVFELANPYTEQPCHGQGNRIALGNIRDRLQLFYGNRASLHCETIQGRFIVRIVLPYQQTK